MQRFEENASFTRLSLRPNRLKHGAILMRCHQLTRGRLSSAQRGAAKLSSTERRLNQVSRLAYSCNPNG